LITRQRENLRRTFVLAEQTTADTATIARLARTERELAAATAEFTAGIEQRAGPVPCLHDAQEAMTSAAAALEKQDVHSAAALEETALTNLIKARRNIRQILKENSSSASACRQFDAQQRQKLRKPPQKDKKAELAKLQQEIEKLAQEEKKFSEEIAAKSGGAQPDKDANSQAKPQSGQKKGSSSANGQQGSQSSSGLAARQEKAAAKAAELQRLVREDEALTDLARNRMDAAADAVKGSAESMRAGRERQAGERAADAAEQLERLARHVAGLKGSDLTTRVGQSERLARQLAARQQRLGQQLQEKGKEGGDKPGSGRGSAEEEGRLAEEGRTLADLLRRLQEDATGQNPDLARQLREAGETNPPQKAVEQMGRAADALKEARTDAARRDMDDSARLLDGLGQRLESARHGLTQPQLDRLLALEKQAAEAQKALESASGERQKAEAEKKVTDLREALAGVRPSDPRLAEAAAALRPGTGTWRPRPEPHDPRLGAYVPPQEYTEGVPRVIKVLQAKIQEVILKDALLDKDEAVPPQYKALVEEYYRVLSEDLR
jgi:hypothetical protein